MLLLAVMCWRAAAHEEEEAAIQAVVQRRFVKVTKKIVSNPPFTGARPHRLLIYANRRSLSFFL